QGWLDGRRRPVRSGRGWIEEPVGGVGSLGPAPGPGAPVVATVVGRYYAMDRDKRWERTKIAYDAMVHGVGEPSPDPIAAIRTAYAAGETDEFVKPRVITGTPRLRSGDDVSCSTFR